MKYLSRLMALVCVMALFAAPGFAQDIDDYAANLQATLTAAQALTDEFLAISDLEVMYDRMYAVVLSETEAPLLNALSAEQVKAISDHANELYLAIEGWTSDDYETLEMTIDMLTFARNGNMATMSPLATAELGSGVWSGGTTLSENTTWNFRSGAVITLKNPVKIAQNVTLTINGSGAFARFSTNKKELFIIEKGGKLVVNGISKEQQFSFDGKGVDADRPLIVSTGGIIELKYTTIKNSFSKFQGSDPNKYEAIYYGGGVYVNDQGSLLMDGCLVTTCSNTHYGGGVCSAGNTTIKNSEFYGNAAGSSGGAIAAVSTSCIIESTLIHNNSAGTYGGGVYATGNDNSDSITIKGSEIYENSAESEDGGRGGALGINSTKCTIENTEIHHNNSFYYGGAIQLMGSQNTGGSGASLTLESGTTISYNTAVKGGAAGIHVTGNSTFTMNSGSEISYNTGGGYGGAIHTSYSCTLNLNGGEIKNNTIYGRGGGIHVDVGGALIINGTSITGNRALNVAADGFVMNNDQGGIGGGLCVDAGSLTLNAGKISNNTADVAGGGVALVMLIIPDDEKFDQTRTSAFTMNAGTVSGNEAPIGGGVYLMENKYKDIEKSYFKFGEKVTTEQKNKVYEHLDNLKKTAPSVTINAGTVSGNYASNNGGAIYQEVDTTFEITGGELKNNHARNDGGAVYIESGTATIDGGEIRRNYAQKNGGALHVNGTVAMTAGTIEANGINGDDVVATQNGGAIYVSSGTVSMNGSAVIVTGNKTTGSGGAIYVNDGDFEMSNGIITQNNAIQNGGAIYINNGHMTMISGTVTDNEAVYGGAAYIAKGNFTMISGEMSNNIAQTDGGGVYANGGDITVGVENCSGEGTNHDVTYTGLTHPKIVDNTAIAGGGFAVAGNGNATMYCGELANNLADNKGLGYNLYMEGGTFTLHSGVLGLTTDPGAVIAGGVFNDLREFDGDDQEINYHSNFFIGDCLVYEADGKTGRYINLPAPEAFKDTSWEANIPVGLTFIGWTTKPDPRNADHPNGEYVTSKDDYKALGEAVAIKKDEVLSDGTVDFYAVWAPMVNYITYMDTTLFDQQIENPVSYQFSRRNSDVTKLTIVAPTRAGYTFEGWLLTLNKFDESKEPSVESNYGHGDWGEEPLLLPFDEESEITTLETATHFGHITLTAQWKPAFSGLEIVVTGSSTLDENESYYFKVFGEPSDTEKDDFTMYVSVIPDASGYGSTTIYNIPVGDYTITKINDWSWRYSSTVKEPADDNNFTGRLKMYSRGATANTTQTVNIPTIKQGKTVTFKVERNKHQWLDDNANRSYPN